MLLETLLYLSTNLSYINTDKLDINNKTRIVFNVKQESAKYGIDPKLVLAIIRTESNFNVKALGKSHGEIGLMQLHPKFFPTANFNVEDNISQGVRYLASIKKVCHSKYGEAWFICYNTGPNKVIKYPTKFNYYKKVKEEYAKY